MILQQFVNTDESLGLPALFSARKLTKWYGFCDLFKCHMVCCFLHYLLIFSVRMTSGQIVRFRIKILRKITVTQFFLKDKSEEKVPNFAIDRLSGEGIFSFRVGILIFMHNIWCVNSFFVYNHHHVILNSHELRVLRRTIESSGEDFMLMRHAYVMWSWCRAGWKLLTSRYFWKSSCHFVCFLAFFQF